MPRITGVRQRLHQPLYDTLIRATGNPPVAIQPTGSLFGNSNVGNNSLTNLQAAGQLASDQTYVILSMRSYHYFDGTNARALGQQVSSQLRWNLKLGDRTQFLSFAWYFPAGGGNFSFDSTTAVNNNGYPAGGAIFKLARPIIIPVRQSILVEYNFFPLPGVGPATTTDVVTLLNAGANDDQKVIQFWIDGMQTRDVL